MKIIKNGTLLLDHSMRMILRILIHSQLLLYSFQAKLCYYSSIMNYTELCCVFFRVLFFSLVVNSEISVQLIAMIICEFIILL